MKDEQTRSHASSMGTAERPTRRTVPASPRPPHSLTRTGTINEYYLGHFGTPKKLRLDQRVFATVFTRCLLAELQQVYRKPPDATIGTQQGAKAQM